MRDARSHILVLASLLLPAVSLEATRVSADDHAPSAERDAPAKNHFTRGRAAYEHGDFRVALDAFQASYAITQHPKLLYNIGLASQKLGLVTDAIHAFESYLAWGEGDREEEVRGRLTALRDLADRDAAFAQQASAAPSPAEAAATAESAPAPAPPVRRAPGQSESKPRKWWPWVLAGGVVAAVAAVAIAVPLARKDDPGRAPVEPNTGLSFDALWRSR